MTYTELVAAIKAYSENYDTTSPGGFVENIPVFVQNAEQRIYNSVQIPSLRKNVTGTLTNGNKYLSAPNDYLSTYSLAVINPDTSYTYLLNKDVNFIREAYPTPTSTGTPVYYALFGSQYTNTNELSFIVGPTPDSSYSVELHYFYYPESIVTAGTSWLGDNFSLVLLYGAMVEACEYMKSDPDVMATYKDRYTDALMQLNRLGTGLERGDAYRDGQAKIKVSP
jgi:hypothetical protein